MARDLENAKRLKCEWYLKNRELTKARSKKWAEENQEKRKDIYTKYRNEHNEKHLAYNRDWFKENPQKRAAYEAKRRCDLINRTPKWMSDDEIWLVEEFYDLAKKRSDAFGFEWHVDHVIPLNGKKVSGLHVTSNLQVIVGKENCKKGARYTV